jgi:hypothetical protein
VGLYACPIGDRLERWEAARAVPRQWRRAAQEGGDLMFGVDVYRGQFSGHGACIRQRYAQRLAAKPPGQDPELVATDAETRPGAGE